MDEYDVVILGAGYAGLVCALRLTGHMRRTPFRVALINRQPDFVERLRLHEQISKRNAWPLPRRIPPLTHLAAESGFTFIEGDVTGLDRGAHTVSSVLAKQRSTIRYRRLVVALGSQVDTETVPGVAEHALTLDADGPRAQDTLRQHLLALPLQAPIVVVGGGATGIEIASDVAASGRPNVTLVDGAEVGAFATPPVKQLILAALVRSGVRLVQKTRVLAVEHDRLVVETGTIAAALCIWCGGFTAGAGLRGLGLALERDGRIPIDPYLRAIEDPLIYAAGDACIPVEPHGAPPRRSAFFALATGAHVADTIAASCRGKEARPFGFWTWGQAISVGREAVGYATIPHDRQIGPIYRRRTAFWLRWFFVWLLAKILMWHLRWPRLPFWLGKHSWRRADVRKYASPPADGAVDLG